jgi:hypothetical protein
MIIIVSAYVFLLFMFMFKPTYMYHEGRFDRPPWGPYFFFHVVSVALAYLIDRICGS